MNSETKRIFSKDIIQFLMLFALFFVSSFVYNILLPLKKTVIMYIPGAGSEAMAYLKPFFITPGSIILTSIFLFLSSRYNKNQVFRTILGIFTGYFFLYRFLFAPYRTYFSATRISSALVWILPLNFQAAPPLVEYWMDTTFYTMAELWGTTVVSLMIWGLVNQNMTQDKAQSRYGLLSIGANSSAIVSGWLSIYLGQQSLSWEDLFNSVLNAVLCGCVLTWIIYEVLIAQGWLSDRSIENAMQKSTTNGKSFGLLGCFSHVFAHQRLWAIAIIVLGYNTLYTLSDFMFTKQVELYFGVNDKIQSNMFLAQVSLATGISATIFALILYPIAIHFGGWLWAALLTPLCFLVTGVFFYGSQYTQFMSTAVLSHTLTASAPIVAGALHIAFLRGARYSVFDATKEAAYVGLPVADQIQGKAAIDAIASRVGRSLGSLVFFVLFAILGNSITAALPYIMLVGAMGTVYWIRSIFVLNSIRHKDLEEITLTSPNNVSFA